MAETCKLLKICGMRNKYWGAKNIFLEILVTGFILDSIFMP